MPEATLFIATPMYGGMATGIYTAALLQVPGVFGSNGIGLCYSYRMNDSLIIRARNWLTREFLASEATHLMWIDADIGFNPQDIVTMVQADEDVVCGLYPRKRIEWDRVARAVKDGLPTEMLGRVASELVVNLTDDFEPDAPIVPGRLLEIASAGTGFMLIKRGVFDALAENVPTYTEEGVAVHAFYDTSIDPTTGVMLSEDYHFCKLARDHGFTLYAAPWVGLTHAGTHLFDGRG